MTKYREILRLSSLSLSLQEIVASCSVSKKTVVKVQKRAKDLGISWPLDPSMTDQQLETIMFPKSLKTGENKQMPDFEYIRKELLRNGVNKKLLWTEYLEDCRRDSSNPLMYSQFCYYIQQDEMKRHATMHIPRDPGKQAEVDWAGDTATVIDRNTGEIFKAHIFVGVMTYSSYAYAEAFPNEQEPSWIKANVHMLEYFGGIPRIIVPDNTSTAVVHDNKWTERNLNKTYQEFAEHYGTAIIPARVRKPKDKPNAEGAVRAIATWVIAALRNEKFFTFADMNRRIRDKLSEFNSSPFQGKEGSRLELFRDEELPFLAPLPATPYELASWKKAKVQFNYHISVDSMHYSVPYTFIGKSVDVKMTDSVIEVYYNNTRIASHKRLNGRKGQYSTISDHMPEEHRNYEQWNGDRFRKWARTIGINTYKVIDRILLSRSVEEQTYLGCRALLKLSDRYSAGQLEDACTKALSVSMRPSYKTVKNILAAVSEKNTVDKTDASGSMDSENPYGVTRGSDYYGG